MDEKPSRLSAILSTEYGDCSIVAAQTAMVAEENFNHHPTERTQLLVDGSEYHADVLFLGSNLATPAGRPVQMGLVQYEKNESSGDKDTGRLYLAVIARDDIAVPLASFARRVGSYCDYVQIGDEMSEIVATPEDEVHYDRKGTIELMRTICEADPTIEKSEIVGKPFDDSTVGMFVDFIEQNLVGRLFHDNKKAYFSLLNYADPVRAFAMFDACRNQLGHPSWSPYFRIDNAQQMISFLGIVENLTKSQKEDYAKWYASAARSLQVYANEQSGINPLRDIEDISKWQNDECRVISKMFQSAATRLYAKRTNANKRQGTEFSTSKPSCPEDFAELMTALAVDEQLDRVLGKYSEAYETVLVKVGYLALTASRVTYVTEETVGGVKDVDVSIVVESQHVEPRRFGVTISAAPTANQATVFPEIYNEVLEGAKPSLVLAETIDEMAPYINLAFLEARKQIDRH